MSFLKYLDPLHWFGAGQYSHFWIFLFHSFLFGFGAKFLSVAFLLFGFYLLARRENVIAFLIFLFLSFTFAYLGGFLLVLL